MCDIKEQINSIMATVDTHRQAENTAHSARIAAQWELRKALLTYMQTYGFILARGATLPTRTRDVVLGGWVCPHSPTKLCVYNGRADGMYDHCLFCGKPDERK